MMLGHLLPFRSQSAGALVFYASKIRCSTTENLADVQIPERTKKKLFHRFSLRNAMAIIAAIHILLIAAGIYFCIVAPHTFGIHEALLVASTALLLKTFVKTWTASDFGFWLMTQVFLLFYSLIEANVWLFKLYAIQRATEDDFTSVQYAVFSAVAVIDYCSTLCHAYFACIGERYMSYLACKNYEGVDDQPEPNQRLPHRYETPKGNN